jgi:folate-binding protein YgfZ
MPSTALSAQILILEGPDAGAFAQAQFSSDVLALAAGQWQWSGWLDAQGRVRALLQLARLGEQRYLLLLRGGKASSMIEGLRRFVFRSKVTIEAATTRALVDGDALDLHQVREHGACIDLGMGPYSMTIAEARDDVAQAWRAKSIADGYPWLPDEALDALLAPALSMERLQAVSFAKGCFPGQEIVARLHYRGGHKRHLRRVELSQAVAPGSVLRVNEKDCGIVLDVVANETGAHALAVIADDAAEHAWATDIRVDDRATTIRIDATFAA